MKHKIIDSVIIWAIMVSFSLLGLPVCAETPAEITFTVVELPEEISDCTLLATASAGPSNMPAAQVTLSDINRYTQTVQVEPGTYYCNAAVQYDAAGDYPVSEINGVYEVTLASGESITLNYTVSTEGYYEIITGEQRYHTEIELITPPDDYNPELTAQIGAYLTAPEGFDQHCIVYLGNQYSGQTYALDVYAANQLAAIKTDVAAGQYQYLGARVTGDSSGRYEFSCEQSTMNSANGAVFHLTVIDTVKPDRELTTPSRVSNDTVQQAESYNQAPIAENSPPPSGQTAPAEQALQEKKQRSYLPEIVTLVFLLAGGGAVCLLRKRKNN